MAPTSPRAACRAGSRATRLILIKDTPEWLALWVRGTYRGSFGGEQVPAVHCRSSLPPCPCAIPGGHGLRARLGAHRPCAGPTSPSRGPCRPARLKHGGQREQPLPGANRGRSLGALPQQHPSPRLLHSAPCLRPPCRSIAGGVETASRAISGRDRDRPRPTAAGALRRLTAPPAHVAGGLRVPGHKPGLGTTPAAMLAARPDWSGMWNADPAAHLSPSST